MKIVILALSILLVGCATKIESKPKYDQCGKASWYTLDGNRTASGQIMNSSLMTAAHKTLPFGTNIKVTNQKNGKSVVVRINDRGPFIKGRILDLSKASAKHIGMVRSGTGRVCYSIIRG